MKRVVRLGGRGEEPPADGATVLTPNKNAARTLGVEPLSLEGLARQIVGRERVAPTALTSRLMREMVGELWGMEDVAGMANTLFPPIRELFRAGADPEMRPSSKRAAEVMQTAEAYRTRLREVGLLDPAEVLREAARCVISRQPIHLYSYPRLGRDELAFLDAVAGEGSVVELPWADEALFTENLQVTRELEARGWTLEEEPLEEVWRTPAEVEAHSYPDLEAEVRGTLSRVKELLAGGVETEEIVVVARDDSAYGPTFLSVAREYEIPVAVLYRIPLTSTRAGEWLDLLLGMAEEGFPFEATAQLLCHPFGEGLSQAAWGKARGRRAGGREEWGECGVDLSPYDLPECWPGEDTREGWAARTRELIGWAELKKKVSTLPAERTALSRIQGAIDELAALGPEGESLTRPDFIGELRETLSATDTPLKPDGEGVELHTPLSLFGTSYRYVFALGLVEGEFPAAVSDDPVLDFHERKWLRQEGVHLELAAESARRERLSFWSLLQVPRQSLTLSYPRIAGGREKLASPYFALLGQEPSEPKPRPAASREEARRAYLMRQCPQELDGDPVLGHARHCREVEGRRESSAPFDAHDGVLGAAIDRQERQFSATQLADLSQCGFKWWASSILGLSEPEEGESGISIGWLYHRSLEIAVQRASQKGTTGTPRETILEHLKEAFEEAEGELEAHGMPSWGMRRQSHIQELWQAVEAEGFASEGAEILEAEGYFEGEWRDFAVRGRFDRIDDGPEGIELVDYKSGSSTPKPDLQLPIYREAAAPALYPDKELGEAFYYSIKKGERLSDRAPGEEELEALAIGLKGKLDAGRLPPDVLENDPGQGACRWCDLDPVCRKGPRLGRKQEGNHEEGEGS